MSIHTRQRILGRLRTLMGGPEAADDSELLRRFLAQREEAAFAALVRRHGPLVLGVCRRLLRHEHDAEDAFQAAFLVLARKAGSIRNKGSLAAWLYEVAYHIAARMRAGDARRKLHERQASEMAAQQTDGAAPWQDLAPVLDEELNRLPEKYRRPLVLCCLQGKTHAQAARELGIPAGSLSRYLSRARELLRERLAGRGVALSAALLGTTLAGEAAMAKVPLSFVAETARAALLVTAGEVTHVSARVAALAEGVVKTLFVAKLKMGIVALVLSAALAGSAGVAVQQSLAARPPEADADNGPKAAPDPKPRTDRRGDPLPAGAIDRLGTVRFRHEGEARSLVFSPDGKLLAAKSGPGIVHLWDARTGKELRRFPSIARSLDIGNLIDFSPDGKLLAAPADGKHIALWDVTEGKQVRSLELPEGVAQGPGDWDMHTLGFSPDGKVLAIQGSNDSYLLDVASGKPLHHFKDLAYTLTFAPDGKTFVAGRHEPGAPKAWDLQFRSLRTGEVVRRIEGESAQFIRAIAFAPDGKTLATGIANQILLWDTAGGKVRRRIEAKMGQPAMMAFTPDGRTLVAGGEEDGKVHVWDVATGEERWARSARLSVVRSLALSPDGKTVAVGGVHNAIRLWDVATGRELFAEHQGHDAPVHSVAYSADGKILVSGGDNGQIWIWDARTGKPVRQLTGAPVHVVALSPDGKRVASLGPWHNAVDVWDAAAGEKRFRVTPGPDTDRVQSCTFSADGRTLLAGGWKFPHAKGESGAGWLYSWDADAGRSLGRFPLPDSSFPWSVVCSPDGRTLAIGGAAGAGPIGLWDLREGRQVLALEGHRGGYFCLAFAPDGRILVSGGGQDKSVRLWEAASGKEIFNLEGHRQGVSAVAFSPGGLVVASASGDTRDSQTTVAPHRIRLWDAVTGAPIQDLGGTETNFTSLAFSPDGSRLASGLRDSTVLIWEVPAAARALRRTDGRLGSEELGALWSDLAGDDARKARAGIWKFASAPAQSVPFLAERLAPVPPLDEKRVRQRITDLDSDQFAVRQAAIQELEGVGETAVALLRKALADKPPLETRKRLEDLLTRAIGPLSGEGLRTVRAVEVLEHGGTPEARRLLRKLTSGAPAARLTREAKSSLERLDLQAAR